MKIAALAVCLAVALFTPRMVIAQADLRIRSFSGQAGGNTTLLIPGGEAFFTMSIANAGPAQASNFVVTISVPSKTTPKDALIFVRGEPIPRPCTIGSVIQCTAPVAQVDDLAVAVGFVLTLANDYPWQQGLSATATVSSETLDPVPANNSSTANIAVAPPPTIPALSHFALALFACSLAAVGAVLAFPKV